MATSRLNYGWTKKGNRSRSFFTRRTINWRVESCRVSSFLWEIVEPSACRFKSRKTPFLKNELTLQKRAIRSAETHCIRNSVTWSTDKENASSRFLIRSPRFDKWKRWPTAFHAAQYQPLAIKRAPSPIKRAALVKSEMLAALSSQKKKKTKEGSSLAHITTVLLFIRNGVLLRRVPLLSPF